MIGEKLLKWRLPAVCMLLAALTLAGCGGGGSAPAATRTTSTGSVNTGGAAVLAVSAPAGVTLSIPASTTFSDNAGNPVTGSIPTSVSYSTVAADLPPAARQLPAGTALAAFTDISMGAVKHFSQPVNLAINVSASGAKPGDAMPVYSFDTAAGTWSFAGTELVDGSGNISPQVTHLSTWGVFKSAAPQPVKPTGVTVTAGDAQATVSWGPVAGATSYRVYYATSAGVTAASVTSVDASATPQIVTGLANGTPYYFVVSALSAAGESIVSNEVSTTPFLPIPARPAGISATGKDGQVDLSWGAVATATTYRVYYGTASGVTSSSPTFSEFASAAGSTELQSVTGLAQGSTYYFVVTALNSSGESAISSEKSAVASASTPGSPTAVVFAPSVGAVTVSWAIVPGATSYNVYYLASTLPPTNPPSNVLVLAGSVASTSGAVLNLNIPLPSGVQYYFLVKAVNGLGEGTGTQTKARPSTAL